MTTKMVIHMVTKIVIKMMIQIVIKMVIKLLMKMKLMEMKKTGKMEETEDKESLEITNKFLSFFLLILIFFNEKHEYIDNLYIYTLIHRYRAVEPFNFCNSMSIFCCFCRWNVSMAVR